jgi:DNA repair exonuclease SbcCD ATPase subunit
MTNNEAGAFLNITPDVLKKLDSFDEKLEKIEKHAHTAADALKNGFGSVVVDTSKLENAITSLASKISALNTAEKVFDNIGDSAQQSSVRVEGMSSSISSMAQTLNQLKFSNFSIETFSPENVAKMRESVSQIKSQLKNNTSLSDSDKSALSKEKAMYEEKLKEYQSFINIKNKIAANANAEELRQQQTTYRKMTNVMESYMKKVEEQKQRYESAMKSMADYAAQSPAQRTSAINNTLSFSANAKTLQDDVAAIKSLKEARLQLDKTDKNYQATLNQINSAIAKHNQALTEAGVKSQQLAIRHRNLMDTAGQLSRQLALVFSVSQIEGYISKLANVRGEFELQQRSLEAILQNKAQADQIFNKTVQLAVKSPFQIKELVTFTKQLAAYRIESDKLYDTTKRLADVSAGLGVDMGRLILAYGQVKAAAYLRGTEVRQFTEAGINMYGELQKLFKTRDQADYTTAQIVDMISKRKVTFEDVEQVFENLTSKEGIFYNMQEIQAETLQGKISNLKDSIDVMLNSIGKANEDTLKGSIDSIKVLIDNWETVVEVAKAFGIVVGSMVLLPKIKAAANGVSLLSFAFTKAETALRSLGLAFKTSFPLIALGAALQLVNELWNVHSQYNKMLRESSNKYYTAQLRIGEIDEIAKNDTKKALSSLVKEMNNEGFEIEIKPNISEKEAKEQFEEYKKQYTEFLEDIRKIEANYAENRKKGWLIGNDDIETDLDEYENAFYDFIAKGNKIQAELLRISEESTSLGKGAKEYIQELVKGKKEGENLIDYYKRLADYLEKLQNGVLFAGKKSSIASSFLGTKKDLEKDKEEATKEIREIFDSVNDEVIKGNKTREQFKILIDKGDFSKQWSDIKKQLAYDIYNLGDIKVPLRPGINQEDPQSNPKHERDILAERISLIKEINKEYEKLNKVMGSDKAAMTVMERYASQLKDVQMPKNIIGEAFLPNKENTAKALQELAKIITDFRKKIGAQKDANVLFDEKDADDFKKQLDKTKDNIESMFNGLDLHKKLKDAGLSEAEVQQLFPGLAKTLDDVQKGIEAEYQKKFPKGEYLIADTDANKQYLADLNKLNQQRIKDSQDLVIELTKAYKTQLSDQLQLDMWYYKERSKIYTKVYDEQTKTFKDVLTKEMQEQYSKNLKTQYDKKSSENTWKAFKGTDTYLNMFDNLENVSTKAIENMKAKLETLKEQMKDLDPSQLKEVMNFYNKMDEQLFKRSPLESFLKSYEKIKELKSQGITEEGLLQRIAENDIENTNLQQQISDLNTIIALKKESIEKDSVESSFIEKNKDLYNQSISVLESMVKAKQDTINDNNKENENANKNLKYFKDARSSLEYMKSAWDSVRNAGRQAMGSIVSILETMGEDTDSTSMRLLNMVGTIGDLVIQAVIFQLQLGLCTEAAKEMGVAMNAALGPIGWVLIALQAVATILSSIFGNHDKNLQKEIEEHERKIKKLEREYDKLKESIDNVWDITKLQEYGNELDENINKQIVSLNAMIAAERDKKDTDWDKINEWQEQIEDLRDTLADSANDMIAELGGVGSDENFKTLAENFASAWLEAFQETGDGLSGLQDSFDDFMENYVKQQILLRLSDKFFGKMFEEFDEIIATKTPMEQEDQERYFELQAQITKLRNTANNSVVKSVAKKANAAADEIENSEEYKRLQKAWTDFLKPNDINTEAIKDWSDRMQGVFGEYNEAAEEIFNQIGWEPGGKANLSALTQGITQISEETANELSAILNSVRFFVANQTSDITAIRNILETEFLSSGDGSSNPMLIELKSQTEYLKLMSDNFESILSYSGNSKGRGLRVFIQ